MSLENISGIITPMLTPLDSDGDIDLPALGTLTYRLIDSGSAGIFVGGTAGLGAQLADRQYIALMEATQELVGKQIPLLAGVIEASTPRALERIRLLEKIGYQRFVLTSTFYLPPRGQEELLTHFGRCAEATAMQMTVYNIPLCTGACIDVDTIEKMVDRGWIRAFKDSSGDAGYFRDLCRLGQSSGLPVYQGLRPDMKQLVSLGASGCVPVPGNVRPELFSRAWQAARNNEEVQEFQREIDLLWQALVTPGDFFSGSLYALAREGVLQENLTPPLQLASAARRKSIDQILKTPAK